MNLPLSMHGFALTAGGIESAALSTTMNLSQFLTARSAKLTLAALLMIFSGAAGLAQKLVIPPIRTRSFLLIGGRHASIDLGRLESGRRYRIHVDILSQSSPASGRIDISVGQGVRTLSTASANRDMMRTLTVVSPQGRDHATLEVSGEGEMSGCYSMRIDWQAEAESRMADVEYIPSPNQGTRPRNADLTAIVVHATVTPTTEATVSWFLTQKSQVSANYVVGRDGRIVQMVDDTARAWHAGVSELDGVKNVNDFSIGIEIVNLNDGRDPYTDAQYEAVAAIVRHIREQYSIPDSRIVSHEFVARPIGRKDDPKAFDFPRLLRLSVLPK